MLPPFRTALDAKSPVKLVTCASVMLPVIDAALPAMSPMTCAPVMVPDSEAADVAVAALPLMLMP